MFGFGDKDKDKLEENMEEIKNLINQDESGGGKQVESGKDFEQAFDSPGSVENSSNQGFEPVNNNSNQAQAPSDSDDQNIEEDIQQEVEKFSDVDNEDEVGGQQQDTQSFDSQPEPSQTQEPQVQGQKSGQNQSQKSQPQNTQSGKTEKTPPAANNQQPETEQSQPRTQSFDNQQQRQSQQEPQRSQSNAESDFDREFKGQDNKKREQQDKPGKRSQNRRSRDKESQQSSRDLNDQIPEPPKTKKIDVPEIDKGPLFIKRQKFENAQRMIQEMRYLSDEIQSVINMLEQGLEEDRKTEKEARELLHNFDENRRNVEHIIHPGEE